MLRLTHSRPRLPRFILNSRNYSSQASKLLIPDLPFSMITQLRSFFEKNGYAIIENAIPTQVITRLKEEIEDLTNKQNEAAILSSQMSPEYFLQSGDKINFFLTPQKLEAGKNLKQPLAQYISSIGHAVHELNKFFEAFTYNEVFKSIAQGVFKMQAPVVVQSIYNFTHPSSSDYTPNPQADNSFFRTKPLSCCGAQVMVGDGTLSPMFGVPGSHKEKTKIFMKRGVRKVNDDKQLAKMEGINFQRYQQYTYFWPNEPQYDISESVPLKLNPGSILLLHGDFVYFQGANYTDKIIDSYKFNLVESRGTKWEKDNWLRRGKEVPMRMMLNVNSQEKYSLYDRPRRMYEESIMSNNISQRNFIKKKPSGQTESS